MDGSAASAAWTSAADAFHGSAVVVSVPNLSLKSPPVGVPVTVRSCISPGGEYERASSRAVLVPHEVGLTKKGLAPGAGLTVCGVFLDATSSWHGAYAHSTMSIARTLLETAAQLLGDVDLVARDAVVALVALVGVGALLVGLVQLGEVRSRPQRDRVRQRAGRDAWDHLGPQPGRLPAQRLQVEHAGRNQEEAVGRDRVGHRVPELGVVGA